MATNKNALIRYRTLDQCLQNRFRKWTLEDLMEACSEALYEYEGIDKGVSKRTVQLDIQMMRSDKLGYNAPIVVKDKKFYTYEDPDYSITNIPLTEQDLNRLNEVVQILQQFKGFSHFEEMNEMVKKLEDKVYSARHKARPVIVLEKNESLRGLEFLDVLYQKIQEKKTVKVLYQSFQAAEASTIDFHPYWLKEFRNRWYLVGRKSRSSQLQHLALDRIKNIADSREAFLPNSSGTPEEYYQDVIGVTVPNRRPAIVKLLFNPKDAPYVITKPLHHTQRVHERENGILVTMKVKLNFELEKEILGFGEQVEVLAPERLRRRIEGRLRQASEQYDS